MGIILLEYSRPKIARNRYNYLKRRSRYRSSGNGDINENSYYTGSETGNSGDYITVNALNSLLDLYLTKNEAERTYLKIMDISLYLGNYVTTDLLYSEYYNKADIDIRFLKLAAGEGADISLDAYMLKSDFINNYYTKEEINNILGDLAVGDLSDEIKEYLNLNCVKYSEIDEYINNYIFNTGASKEYVDLNIQDIKDNYVSNSDLEKFILDLNGIDSDILLKHDAIELFQPKGDYITRDDLEAYLPSFEIDGQDINLINYLTKKEAEDNYMKKADLTDFFYLKGEVDLIKDNLYDYINENFAIGAKVGDSDPIYTDASMLINLDEAFNYYINSEQFIEDLINSSTWNEYFDSSINIGIDVSSLINSSTWNEYINSSSFINNFTNSSVWNEYIDTSLLISVLNSSSWNEYFNSSTFINNITNSSVWNEYINSSLNVGLDIEQLNQYLIDNNYKKIILISLEDYDALEEVENDVIYLIDGKICSCGEGTGEGTGDALDETKLITFLLNNNYKKIILISLEDYDVLDVKDPDAVYLIDGQICSCGEGGGQGAPDLTNYYTKAEVDALIPDEPDLSNYVTIDSSNKHNHEEYVSMLVSGTQILGSHLQLGDLNTTAFKQFAAWRKCDSNITGSKVNSASFYVNSDGTAAFFHKTMTDAGASAVADAILKFSWKGLEFAQGANGRTTATEFNKVITEKELNAVTGDILTVLNSLT